MLEMGEITVKHSNVTFECIDKLDSLIFQASPSLSMCITAQTRLKVIHSLMQPRTTARVSLTALLGTPVTDAQGHLPAAEDIARGHGPDAAR